ncbi:hypothetical protein [Ornithinimicrobium pratense]|uniref:Uncharacterized protein n=1 Tax=Ornithinimicrobium pratense TaxID=2593973 RepID=A0A5J6V5A1_9MICO|nr:hypothetical protein [Ornithinimicrobium pratense]QFG68192.1 hypothetical protein FY030_05205 [Ornithinimicrobium pratense]
MSTSTVARPAPAPQSLRPQWMRSFDTTMGVCLYVSKWFLLIMVGIAVVAALIMTRITTPEVSIVQFGQQAGIWFPFSLMIMCGVLTPTIVMHGITRRATSVGSVLTAVAMAALFTAAFAVFLVLERWIFEALGWQAGLASDPERLALGALAPHLPSLFLVFCAANISGLLVHTAYYRLGGLFGTAALPLTLAPVILVGALGGRPNSPGRPWGPAPDSLPGNLAVDLGLWHPVIAIAIITLAAAAYLLLIRTLTLSPKES